MGVSGSETGDWRMAYRREQGLGGQRARLPPGDAIRKRWGKASRGTRRYDFSCVRRSSDRDGSSLWVTGEQSRSGLLAWLHHEPVRFGPAFDGSRFYPVRTVAYLVRGHVVQMNVDQD